MRPPRPARIAGLALAVALLGACSPAPATTSAWAPATAATPTAPTAVADDFPFHPNVIPPTSVGASGFLSWAYVDRRTGVVTGSAEADVAVESHSMIKAWLAADELRLEQVENGAPSEWTLDLITTMIVDSDNDAANDLFWGSLGAEESIIRMIRTCGLTDTVPTANDWAETEISARDAARMGACIADGGVAGPQWSAWLLDTMRAVEGEGDFGIRDAFPATVRDTIAIKNGWWWEDEVFRVNCLAIGDTWTLAVLQRRTDEWDIDSAAATCVQVTDALMVAPL